MSIPQPGGGAATGGVFGGGPCLTGGSVGMGPGGGGGGSLEDPAAFAAGGGRYGFHTAGSPGTASGRRYQLSGGGSLEDPAALGAGGSRCGFASADGHGTGSGRRNVTGGGLYASGFVEAGSGCLAMGGIDTRISGALVTKICPERRWYTCPLFRRTRYLALNGS